MMARKQLSVNDIILVLEGDVSGNDESDEDDEYDKIYSAVAAEVENTEQVLSDMGRLYKNK